MDKEKQSELLKEIVKGDEELGLYSIPDDKWDFYSGLPNPSSYIKNDEEE